MIGDPLMATGFGELKVFSGSAHVELTREIAQFLGVPMGAALGALHGGVFCLAMFLLWWRDRANVSRRRPRAPAVA